MRRARRVRLAYVPAVGQWRFSPAWLNPSGDELGGTRSHPAPLWSGYPHAASGPRAGRHQDWSGEGILISNDPYVEVERILRRAGALCTQDRAILDRSIDELQA